MGKTEDCYHELWCLSDIKTQLCRVITSMEQDSLYAKEEVINDLQTVIMDVFSLEGSLIQELRQSKTPPSAANREKAQGKAIS